MAVEDGIQTIVCSPHALDGVHEVLPERSLPVLEALRTRLEEESIPIELVPGADVHLDARLFAPDFDLEPLTVGQAGRYLLIERPNEMPLETLEEAIFKLRTRKVLPILTHPERYKDLQGKKGTNRLANLVRRGAVVQVTAGAFTGAFGRSNTRAVEAYLDRGLIHLVATDAHSTERRPPVLSEARERIARRTDAATAALLTCDNPRAVLAGEPLAPMSPSR